MTVAGDPEIRRIAARILLAQAATTILIAALCLVFSGRTQALSALAGGLIGLIANAYMTLTTLRSTRNANAAGALGRLMVGQLVKVVLTIGLMLIVAQGQWANWPVLILAYAATMVVFWFVPTLSMRARRTG
jgi:F0F1-type ATP synthase assembly protein I